MRLRIWTFVSRGKIKYRNSCEQSPSAPTGTPAVEGEVLDEEFVLVHGPDLARGLVFERLQRADVRALPPVPVRLSGGICGAEGEC